MLRDAIVLAENPTGVMRLLLKNEVVGPKDLIIEAETLPGLNSLLPGSHHHWCKSII